MYRLVPHAATPPERASGVSLMWMQLASGRHQLTFTVENAQQLVVPGLASRERADGLWQHTCFELFLRKQGGPEYFEFNFSPSQRWAAYAFEKYREGMTHFPMDRAPIIEGAFQGDNYVLRVDVTGLPAGMTVAATSAVLVEVKLAMPVADEEAEGEDSEDTEETPQPEVVGHASSCWALNHPGPKPDFHLPGSFVAPLAPGQL
jgi:hypothetical protein